MRPNNKSVENAMISLFEENKVDLLLYNGLKDMFIKFLKQDEYEKRKEIAYRIVDNIFSTRGKKEKPQLAFNDLIKLELKEIYPSQQDHVVHTVYVLILGIYLYKKHVLFYKTINGKIREVKEEYEVQSRLSDTENHEQNFYYMWFMIAIYHDIGYIFENDDKEFKLKIINKLIDNENEIYELDKNYIQEYNDKEIINFLVDININNKQYSAFELLEQISKETNLSFEKGGISNYLKYCLESESRNKDRKFLDHGIMSALLCLKITSIAFNKDINDGIIRNSSIITSFIKRVAQAIAVHNIFVNNDSYSEYSKYNLNLGDDSKKNNKYKISYNKSPFAYLLALCDAIQIWERPKLGNLNDFKSANDYSIEINNEKIILKVKNEDVEKLKKLKEELKEYLEGVEEILDVTSD